MKASDFDPPIKRDDEQVARRWRGELFHSWSSPIMWKDDYYHFLERPRSVTFPICGLCGHIIWNWPHFEEEIPDKAICDTCFVEEEREQDRDWPDIDE